MRTTRLSRTASILLLTIACALPGFGQASHEEKGSAPNPTRSSASITFALARPEHVRLRLYDEIGEEVMSVIDGSFEAGEHVARLDVDALPAGIYYYRLEAAGLSQTRALIVVR